MSGHLSSAQACQEQTLPELCSAPEPGGQRCGDLVSVLRVSCPWTGAPVCDCKPLWLLTGSCVCVHQRLPRRAPQSGCGFPPLLL